MRSRLPLLTSLPAVLVSCLFATCRADDGDRTTRSTVASAVSEDLLASIRTGLREAKTDGSGHEKSLVRVTAHPFHVVPPSPAACANPFPNDPHKGHWIHVYVTSSGYDTMKSGNGVYPEGTVILKEKFRDATGTKTDVFTGMLKREKGYNAGTGDWEFFVLNARATAVTSADNLRSCIHCHAPFRDTDFVSRSYLSEKARPERAITRDAPP